MPRGAPAASGNGLGKCDPSTVEGPYPLQTPQKRNNPRHASGRIPDMTKQRAATPPGRGRVGTAGSSPPSRVPADAALQATPSSSQPDPRTHAREKGRPRGGGAAVGRRPPLRSRLPSPATWPGAAVRTGVPGTQTAGRRNRRPGEPGGGAGPGRRGSGPLTRRSAPARQLQAPPEPPRRFWAFVASLSPCGTFRRRRIKPAAEEPAARVRRCWEKRVAGRRRERAPGGGGRRRRP